MAADAGAKSSATQSALGLAAAQKLSTAMAVAAAIGLPKPTGRLKESITAATITASLLDSSRLTAAAAAGGAAAGTPVAAPDTNGGTAALGGKRAGDSAAGARGSGAPAGGAGADETGDSLLRPLSIAELKAQASASMAGDRSVKAVRTAAAVAATVLSRS